QPRRLKYCTARSCCSALSRLSNVPRFLRLPVFGSFLREYSRYLPVLSFLIILFSGSGMSMIQRHVLKRRWLAVPFHLRSEDLPTVLAARACPWLARSAVDGHRMRSG